MIQLSLRNWDVNDFAKIISGSNFGQSHMDLYHGGRTTGELKGGWMWWVKLWSSWSWVKSPRICMPLFFTTFPLNILNDFYICLFFNLGWMFAIHSHSLHRFSWGTKTSNGLNCFTNFPQSKKWLEGNWQDIFIVDGKKHLEQPGVSHVFLHWTSHWL